MTLSGFLKTVELGGMRVFSEKSTAHAESFHVVELLDQDLLQRFIVIHEDHIKTRTCSFSINSYHYTLKEAIDFIKNPIGLLGDYTNG